MVNQDTMKAMINLFGKVRPYDLRDERKGKVDATMWSVIEAFNWNANGNENITQIQRAMISHFDNDLLLHASKFASERISELHDKAFNLCTVGGDDSYNDCVSHAVGMGEEYFNKAMANPAILNNLEYKESFSYVLFNGTKDFEKFTTHYHMEQAYKLWGQLNFHATHYKDSDDGLWAKLDIRFEKVLDAIGEGGDKDMDKLWLAVGDLRNKEVYRELSGFCYSYPNILKDMAEYLFDWDTQKDTQKELF